MADSDASAPPPEVATEMKIPVVDLTDAVQEDAASDPAAAAPTQEEEPSEVAEAEGDHKRKLEEVDAGAEANGAGEDAKRPRVEGNGADAVQNSESSEKPQEPVAVITEGAADAQNAEAAPAGDVQTSSEVKPQDTATEAPPQQQEGDATGALQETTRLIDVPNTKVGVLIGKAGETIRNLQMSSGAKIQITKDADVPSDATTRPVELVGTNESIDKAEQLIKSVIAEAEAGGSPALIAKGFGSGQSGSEQFEMLVPDNKVGLIIGKGGETIKNLQTRSGARIQLIPQHPPAGTTLTERTVRVTGNKKQIEAAKELIKQAMSQTFPRNTSQSGGYGPQHHHPQGHGPASQWGPRSQPQQYGYPPRGPPQNAPYSQPPYGGYPQQPPPRGGMGWDQRQGPPPHQGGGYDYYKQGSQPYESQPPNYPPGPGNYNSYGPSQAPSYGQPQYPQSAPPQNYGPGYGDPRYSAPAPAQQYYGQPPAGPQQGYPQQPDPYARPPYGGPGQWPPRGSAPADGPYQAPPPASYAPPAQQPPAYGQTYPTGPDGYAQQGYSQQGGQGPAAYGQSAPAGPGYSQQGGYAQYPASQPAYGDQSAQNNANYGYQGAPADPSYGNAYPQSGYAAAPTTGQPGYGQAGYTQPPATNPPSYDQSAPPAAQSGYAAPAANPQPAVAKGVSPQPATAAGYGGQWTA
ncbi:far upstream element-binding protein 1-like [Triticum dicoccoides]|uniref:far upstream element-binding protein 1-like n=1 Tax=Triticum dicoccoides TaxID=85692 RepID=UPI00189143F3|nr:far upstream element-binding protein 1-like [Triticum dicoccoides]